MLDAKLLYCLHLISLTVLFFPILFLLPMLSRESCMPALRHFNYKNAASAFGIHRQCRLKYRVT